MTAMISIRDSEDVHLDNNTTIGPGSHIDFNNVKRGVIEHHTAIRTDDIKIKSDLLIQTIRSSSLSIKRKRALIEQVHIIMNPENGLQPEKIEDLKTKLRVVGAVAVSYLVQLAAALTAHQATKGQ